MQTANLTVEQVRVVVAEHAGFDYEDSLVGVIYCATHEKLPTWAKPAPYLRRVPAGKWSQYLVVIQDDEGPSPVEGFNAGWLAVWTEDGRLWCEWLVNFGMCEE